MVLEYIFLHKQNCWTVCGLRSLICRMRGDDGMGDNRNGAANGSNRPIKLNNATIAPLNCDQATVSTWFVDDCSYVMASITVTDERYFNSMLPIFKTLTRQRGRHFADDICKCISLYGNHCVSIPIVLKFVPKGPNINKPTLFLITVLRQTRRAIVWISLDLQ